MLETSALKTPRGGQFILSTLIMKPNYPVVPHHKAVFLETSPPLID